MERRRRAVVRHTPASMQRPSLLCLHHAMRSVTINEKDREAVSFEADAAVRGYRLYAGNPVGAPGKKKRQLSSIPHTYSAYVMCYMVTVTHHLPKKNESNDAMELEVSMTIELKTYNDDQDLRKYRIPPVWVQTSWVLNTLRTQMNDPLHEPDTDVDDEINGDTDPEEEVRLWNATTRT